MSGICDVSLKAIRWFVRLNVPHGIVGWMNIYEGYETCVFFSAPSSVFSFVFIFHLSSIHELYLGSAITTFTIASLTFTTRFGVLCGVIYMICWYSL